MTSRRYFTLMASLPPLPRLERAERLPINRQRLEERLTMLEDEDSEVVQTAWDYLLWQRQPIDRTDAEVARFYREITTSPSHPTLIKLIEFRMTERTLMVALRRRRRGLGPPKAGEPWGVGPWVRAIENGWDATDFKLGSVFPWIDEARRRLEADDSLGLQQLLMNLVWDHLVAIGEKDPFSFDALLAYLFRWDILNRWLTHDPPTAQRRFEALLAEVTDGHRQIFTN